MSGRAVTVVVKKNVQAFTAAQAGKLATELEGTQAELERAQQELLELRQSGEHTNVKCGVNAKVKTER